MLVVSSGDAEDQSIRLVVATCVIRFGNAGAAQSVVAAAAGPAVGGAAAPRLVVAGLGDVQLVPEPEGIPLTPHRASVS